MRFEPAASEVKGKCANHLATEAPHSRLSKEIRTSDRSQSVQELPRVRTLKLKQAYTSIQARAASQPKQTKDTVYTLQLRLISFLPWPLMQGVQIPSGSVPTAKEIIAPADSVSSIHDPVYEPHAVHGAAIVPDQLPPTPPVAGLSNDDVTLEVCMHLCIYFSLHLIAACVLKDYSIVISPYAMF